MNPGHTIFKNAQRLQGGSANTSPGRMWYPGINLPPMVKMILNTNPYYQAVKAGVIAPQILWRLGGSIGHLMNKLFPGGPGQQQPQGDDGTGTPAPTGTASPPQEKPPPSAGVGIDPEGNPADPGEWWSNDFGRWDTDKYGTTPGNYWNQGGPGGPPGSLGLGFNVGGSGTVGNFNTAIGFGGSYGGGSNAGILSSASRGQRQADLIRNSIMAGTYNPTGAVHAPHGYSTPAFTNAYSNPAYGRFLEGKGLGAPQTAGGPSSVNWDAVGQAWQNSAAAGGVGDPQGGFKANYGHTPKRAAFAMGTSSVNQGSKLFHAQLKRKK